MERSVSLWRWVAVALLGAVSGALAITGVGVVLLQSGVIDPDLAVHAPNIGIVLGLLTALVRRSRIFDRVVTLALLALVGLVVFVAVTPAAAALRNATQGVCRVVVTTAGVATPMDETSAQQPLLIDLDEPVELDVVASAEGVVNGTVTVVLADVHPFGFPGDGAGTELLERRISGGIAEVTIRVERAGASGFVVSGPGFSAPMLPLGLLEIDFVVRDDDGVERCATLTGWIRVVTTPISNPVGVAGVVLAVLGSLGLVVTAALRRRLVPRGTAGSAEPVAPRPDSVTGQPEATQPESRQPEARPIHPEPPSLIPAGGPHAPHLETQILDGSGIPLPVDRPVPFGIDAVLRVATVPGSHLATPGATGPGTAAGTPLDPGSGANGLTGHLRVAVAETGVTGAAGVVSSASVPVGGAVEIPLGSQIDGDHELTLDLTANGHLLQTERVRYTVAAADARGPVAAATTVSGVAGTGASTRTIFAASDLSAADLGARPRRDLLLILERDPVDGSVDARALDGDGTLLVRIDTTVQPEAITAAAAIARGQLQTVLQAGPGMRRDVPAEDIAATLLPLVKVGRTLYGALFAAETILEGDAIAVSSRVRDGATVQVVQNRAGLGFSTLPWNLVYDHPFIARTAGNLVCPTFRTHPVDDCPQRSDANVFCPTGFWGYRAVIEEPWVVMGAEPLPAAVATEPAPGLGAAYHLPGLSFSPVGTRFLEAAGVATIIDFDGLLGLVESEADRLSLLYFYTHHDRDPHDQTPGIVIGGELLSAGTLDALPARWTQRPLVFVNGCASGDYTLTDPVSLLDKFRAKGAAGMVVTECVMWDRLAGELGAEVIDALFDGGNLGPSLLALRRRLLVDHGNPVGLAYRMHAMSETAVQLAPAAATLPSSATETAVPEQPGAGPPGSGPPDAGPPDAGPPDGGPVGDPGSTDSLDP